ncbi:PhzF family phenazine biosynthesis protein [Sphingosinicella sp. BN140058]|uniref:PhzF family phenazine biosynthesis protein n=1 Tax=Sphingosinicella sp. BN140058 TaxID=1892855 RepID=UPI0010131A5E|nr:PhzF family phenazine biosynthesis protein [Sphingosinicella sp. BN140058]QAY76259.1 PhzF family phenazine biosynthesis protein [Sphingosinicella sp. BN140058]
MTAYRLVQVDAFADRPFTGNPAAVVPLEEWLPDAVMQAIAEENNLSETAFTVPTGGDADYELRWFTPTTEVALCGHATLASGHVLLEGEQVRFRTRKAGILVVGSDGDGYTLDLPQTLVREADAEALRSFVSRDGSGLVDLLTADPASRAAAKAFLSYKGAEATAIVLFENEAQVRGCAPDMARLREVELMVIVTAPGESHDVVSRVFVPAWGVDEDPVTGSAHGALVPFWCERLGRDSFTAFQASRRGGALTCRRAGERAILRGQCVTVIEGMLQI